MSDSTKSVEVRIPGPSASTSKMAKKDWKCWAKVVEELTQPKPGQPTTAENYVGTRLSYGVTPLPVGAVVLHYDDSSEHGVGVVTADGEIEWEETCHGEGWPVALRAATKRLLAAAPITEPAQATVAVAPAEAADRPDARAATVAAIRALMAAHGITAADLA